ncbi:hypothetical protein KQ306_00605 [Synechococcus sp. CS-1324]|uniref:hypothetical protein n=1 Tax=Synechococcus sp. CS-1324 TaxID=2847980 RepID=UPI000DB1E76D|nr:hypothetical protein [Synechococcus sp. CS-1324]MCT0229363.1 hypothetical protein [Synechococcus sp. CS-1324]PZV01564.1 MAG: hypothetical protein DCF23_12880 [Cyanobium sp.]
MAFPFTTGEVQAALRITKNTLTRLRAADILRPGVHFTAHGVGLVRPNLRWDLDAVEATLARRGKQIARPKMEAGRQ